MKMINPKKIFLFTCLLSLFLLAGCATTMYYWYIPPGKTQADFNRALKECEYEVELHAGRSDAPETLGEAIGSGMAEGLRQRELIIKCMRVKGYAITEEEAIQKGITIQK